MIKNINYWYLSSLLVSLLVALPILTVFSSFFGSTSDYFLLLKDTFLINYIVNTIIILVGVLLLTLIFGVLSAYFVSFYNFPFSNFFSWALILAFAVPGYIYAFSIIAFFENYGTAFSILTFLFGENDAAVKLNDKMINRLKLSGSKVAVKEIANADHWLPLTHKESVIREIL